MCAIAQHFARPGTATDQASIESLFTPIEADWPRLDHNTERDPRAELASARNTRRLHAEIGYVTPDDEHDGRGRRSAEPAASAFGGPAACGSTATRPAIRRSAGRQAKALGKGPQD